MGEKVSKKIFQIWSKYNGVLTLKYYGQYIYI